MGLPGIPPFIILSPIPSDEEIMQIMLNRRRGQLRGHLAHAPRHGGRTAATRCSTLPVHGVPLSRGLRNCPAWCFAPRDPPGGCDQHPAGPVKYLKYLRLKTLA